MANTANIMIRNSNGQIDSIAPLGEIFSTALSVSIGYHNRTISYLRKDLELISNGLVGLFNNLEKFETKLDELEKNKLRELNGLITSFESQYLQYQTSKDSLFSPKDIATEGIKTVSQLIAFLEKFAQEYINGTNVNCELTPTNFNYAAVSQSTTVQGYNNINTSYCGSCKYQSKRVINYSFTDIAQSNFLYCIIRTGQILDYLNNMHIVEKATCLAAYTSLLKKVRDIITNNVLSPLYTGLTFTDFYSPYSDIYNSLLGDRKRRCEYDITELMSYDPSGDPPSLFDITDSQYPDRSLDINRINSIFTIINTIKIIDKSIETISTITSNSTQLSGFEEFKNAFFNSPKQLNK